MEWEWEWEELPNMRGVAAKGGVARDKWSLSIGKIGVRIIFPDGHPLLKNKRLRTHFSRGTNAGWMLLQPTTDPHLGRVINFSNKPMVRPSILFKTVPGVSPGDRSSPITLEAVDMEGGMVRLRLPWINPDESWQGFYRPEVLKTKETEETAAPAPEPASQPARDASQTKPLAAVSASQSNLRRDPRSGQVDSRWPDNTAVHDFPVKHMLSLEQAAEYLRSKRVRCVIQVAEGSKSATSGSRYLERSKIVVDGNEIPVGAFFDIVNDYREEEGLPPATPPTGVNAAA